MHKSKGRYHDLITNASINNVGAKAYFAAANGKRGFYSLYGEIFNEKEQNKIYILKGGPGTGKSTLLTKIAKKASEQGLETEIFLCSSDPRSLDGVSIPALGISVIDGTAPHSHDPQFPGVSGEIVNLGENWNGEILKKYRSIIEKLFASKSKEYERAYRFLSAAGEADANTISGIAAAVDATKSESMAKRLLYKISNPSNKTEKIIRRFTSAYSTVGTVTLDTPKINAQRNVTVNYNYGAGVLFMNALCSMSISGGYPITIIPSALSPENTDAIIFHDTYTAVSLAFNDEAYQIGDVSVNTGRFVDKDILRKIRGKQRFSVKIKESLVNEATGSLKEAGRIHEEIEKIYGKAMDFDNISKRSDELIDKIFN